MNALLEFKRIGAEVNVFFARHEAVYDLNDLRMQQGLAARDGHHRRAALFNGREALLWRKLFLQNVWGILHLAATGAGQVATEQRLKHQHQRIALVSLELLLPHVLDHRRCV